MRLSSLHIHPIKGCRAVSLDEVRIDPWGPAGDRRWLVVDATGRFITQREAPVLATLTVDATLAGLRLTAPGHDALDVRTPGPGAERRDVVIFRDRVSAVRAEEAAGRWLSEVVGEPCHLMHMDEPSSARPAAGGAGPVSFADEHPVLLVNTASLEDFNGRTGLSARIGRFRPNLVIEGAEAWAEDGWGGVSVGEVEFEVVQDCGRCVVTTIDQETGERSEDVEPLRSLGEVRRTAGGKIPFGVHLRPLAPGTVRVGDDLRVLARRTAEVSRPSTRR